MTDFTIKNFNFGYNQSIKAKKVLKYSVIFEASTDGGYIASVPLLPGCTTQGETLLEAKENIKDAIKVYIKVLKEDFDEIPVEGDEQISISTVVVPVMR